MDLGRFGVALALGLSSGCSLAFERSEPSDDGGAGVSGAAAAAAPTPGSGGAATAGASSAGNTSASAGTNAAAGSTAAGGGGAAGVSGSGGGSASGGSAAGSGGSPWSPPTTLCADTTAYAHCEATDFSVEDVFGNPKWEISTWSNDNRSHSPDNVWVEDGLLVMRVNGGTPAGEETVGAEIFTTKNDFLYGSFRALARTAAEPGTVSSPLFYYLSDISEIDVEILSEENDDGLVNFTVHQNNQGANTYRLFEAGFDPSADFHEYRFDWTPAGVTFYLDGARTGVTLTGNTPYQLGRMMVNHWTLSDPAWGGGPPAADAFMFVKYLEFYFD